MVLMIFSRGNLLFYLPFIRHLPPLPRISRVWEMANPEVAGSGAQMPGSSHVPVRRSSTTAQQSPGSGYASHQIHAGYWRCCSYFLKPAVF